MAKATSKHKQRKTGPVVENILGGPVQRPYPGVRSVPAKDMRRAVKEVLREQAAEDRARPPKT
jgi:hypothetical protein